MPLKSNSLSDRDMIKILKSQKINMNGIYMKDELPQKLKKGFYIVNLASEKDNSRGTHWTGLYYSPKYSYYFDSYGFVPPVEVEIKIKPYIYNEIDIQSYSSTACGFYCIAFIIYMNSQNNKLEGFNAFVQHFSRQTKENDKTLYNLLYN